MSNYNSTRSLVTKRAGLNLSQNKDGNYYLKATQKFVKLMIDVHYSMCFSGIFCAHSISQVPSIYRIYMFFTLTITDIQLDRLTRVS